MHLRLYCNIFKQKHGFNHAPYKKTINYYSFYFQKHEQVLKLMSTMLSQVVQLQPIAGSSRERLQILAEEIAFRYVGDSFKCSRQIYTTFHILKDLLNFFDHYHNNQHVLALEAMQRLQIIPLSMDEVEEKVANFKNLDTEVCRVLPDILLATMNILHKRYMHIQEGSDGNRGRFDDSERASVSYLLRSGPDWDMKTSALPSS